MECYPPGDKCMKHLLLGKKVMKTKLKLGRLNSSCFLIVFNPLHPASSGSDILPVLVWNFGAQYKELSASEKSNLIKEFAKFQKAESISHCINGQCCCGCGSKGRMATAHPSVLSLYTTMTMTMLSAVTFTVGALGTTHSMLVSGIAATSCWAYSGASGTGYEISTAPVGQVRTPCE